MKKEKTIYFEMLFNVSPEEIWRAWTTPEGIKSFFAPACNIDIRPDGDYEILFNPDAPDGKKGAEGVKVMAVQPNNFFSFTWNSPPHLPSVRNQKTHVVLLFHPEGAGTRMRLHHDGWGAGGEWDDAYDYFVRAWGDIVLPRLKYRFETGPVDWANPPGRDVLDVLK